MAFYGRLNTAIPASHGISYTDPDGTKFHEAYFPILLRRIMIHRMDNGGDLSVGWQDDVGDGVCDQLEAAGVTIKACSKHARSKGRSLHMSDMKVFFATTTKWAASGFKVVDQEEANRRAKICASCPRNVKVEGCSGCYNLVSKVRKVVGDRHTDHDAELRGCEVCACSLAAKVWLPRKVMAGTRDKSQWPDHCWIPE